MKFSFRHNCLLTAVVTLSLVALLTFSVNADYFEEAFNSSNPVTLGDNDVLVIKSTDENSRYTYNNYSGSGRVYLSLERLSFFNTNIPGDYTNSQVFIVGNALGLPDLGIDESSNPKTSSSVFGNGRILVLTNEDPYGTTTNEGALFNDNGSTPIYDNPIQIKGVGGIRVGWNANLTVSGKISDYTDANGSVTPGKLILESDSSDTRILNGANDYSGGTQISGGNSAYGSGALTQTVQVDGTPYGTGPISFGAAGSVLALNNHAITVGGFDGGTTGTVSGADTLTINIGANNYSAPVTINNVANLTVTGTGSQTVAAADVTNLIVSEGEMSFTGALNVPGSITIANGATLKMDGANSSLTAGNQVTIQNGATLYFNDAAPRNPADKPLAINIENGGTLEFHEITTGESHANTTLVASSNIISITGSGNFIKSGPGDLFVASGKDIWQGLTIVLNSDATIDVREGCLANGNYFPDSWKSTVDGVTTYNQATLNIGPNGTVDLWDGIMHVGGITGGSIEGDNHGIINSPKYNSSLIVGMGMDTEKSFVYNGDVDLNSGRNFTKEGKTTQVMAGTYSNLGNTNVNDGTLEISGTATLGTANVNGGTLKISSNDATLKTSNLNGGSLDVSGTATMEAINFADGGKLNVIENGVVTLSKTTNLNQYTNITVDENASFIIDPGNEGEQYVAQSQGGAFNITGKVTAKSGFFRVINVPNTATIVLDGGTLQNNGVSEIYQSTVDANIILASDSRLMGGWGDKGGTLTVNGVISGDAKLIIRNDGGFVYLNNTNVHTGGTQIGDNYDNSHTGQLVMGADNALGTGPISFGKNNANLDMATYSQVFNGIDNQNGSGGNYTGNKIIRTDSLESPTFNAADGTNFIYTGTMPEMSGTLTKTGKGSQTIVTASVNDVNVTEGTMAFSGALTADNVTIASGATLKLTGTGSSLTVANPIEIPDGGMLYFENAVPRNNNNTPLSINIAEGGTLKFYETITDEHIANNTLANTGDNHYNVTITGDGNFIKTGSGRLFTYRNSTYNNSNYLSIILSDKAVIDVQEGDFVNGGWEPDCWKKTVDGNTTYNQATLNIGPNGTVDLWDGTLYVGGITGGDADNKGGNIISKNAGHIVVGMGMTEAKSFTFNGDVNLNYGNGAENTETNRTFTKEGATTQIFTGLFKNLGTVNVNDGTLAFSGTAILGTVNFAEGGKLHVIENGVVTLSKTTNLNQYTNITVDENASFIIDPGNEGEQYVAQSQGGAFNITGKVTAKSGFFRVINVPNTATIVLDGGTLQNNGVSEIYQSTVDANIILASDSRLMGGWGDKGGTLTVNGVISGDAKLIIRNDGGFVYLNNTNVHTGGTQIGDNYDNSHTGQLVMGADNALGTGPISFGKNNANLDMATYSQVFNGIDNQNGSGGNYTGNKIIRTDSLESPTFNAADGTNFIYTGTMPEMSGTLTKTGKGSQTIVTASVNDVNVTEGTMAFSGALTADNVTIASGATLKLTGTGSSLTVANPIEIPDGGMLYFENAVPRNNNNTPLSINIAEGGTLKFYETITDEHIANNTLANTGDNHYNVTITGDGNFIKTGSGRLFTYRNSTYNNSNYLSIILSDKAVIDVQEGDFVNGGWEPDCWKKTVDGNTTYNQATLNIGPNGTVDLWDGTLYVGGITGGDADNKGGNIISKNAGHIVVGMGMTEAKSFTFNGDVNLNYGNGAENTETNRTFTKEGATTQIFTGLFKNLGTVNVNGGTLELAGTGEIGTLVFNGGTLDITDGTTTLLRSGNLTVNTKINVSENAALVMDLGTYQQKQTTTDPLNITGKLVHKSGEFWTVNLSDQTQLELAGGIIKNNGDVTPVSTINSNIILSADSSLMAGWENGKIDVNGVVSGPGKLIIRNDMGNVYLNNSNNSYTGGTQVGDDYDNGHTGQLVAGAENVLGTGRLYFGKDGSTFDMAGFAQTIGGLGKDVNANETQYSGSINNTGAETTLTLNVPAGETYNYAGSVANNISIVKTGAGTQQFNLAQNATFAKEILVTNGRLDMKEYYTGLLSVKSGGVFSPGNSIGTLYLTGDFNLDGGTLLMEVDGPTAADNDQLIINGNLLLNDGDIVLQLLGDLAPNAEFAVVIDAANSADPNLDILSFVNSYYFTDLSYGLIDGLWTLSGKVDPNAVPEPSTWALLALGVFGLLYLRKKVRN